MDLNAIKSERVAEGMLMTTRNTVTDATLNLGVTLLGALGTVTHPDQRNGFGASLIAAWHELAAADRAAANPPLTGLVIELSGTELAESLSDRAKYHTQRAADYQQQADAIRSKQLDQELQHQTNNPVQGLTTSAQQHRTRAAYFRFIAEHVVTSETYRLAEQELTRLEVLDRYL
jgi:hypothetical protein